MPEVCFFANLGWYTYSGTKDPPSTEHTVATSSRQDGLSKLECLIRFDEANYWLSQTRELIANAEAYSYPMFRESFREARREARNAEFALVVALYQFYRGMEEQAT